MHGTNQKNVEPKIMNRIQTIAVGVLLLVAMGIVGQMDYEDAIAQDEHYCDMVREGSWPNFKPEIDCAQVEAQRVIRGTKL
jgi:hypothetical protein